MPECAPQQQPSRAAPGAAEVAHVRRLKQEACCCCASGNRRKAPGPSRPRSECLAPGACAQSSPTVSRGARQHGCSRTRQKPSTCAKTLASGGIEQAVRDAARCHTRQLPTMYVTSQSTCRQSGALRNRTSSCAHLPILNRCGSWAARVRGQICRSATARDSGSDPSLRPAVRPGLQKLLNLKTCQ